MLPNRVGFKYLSNPLMQLLKAQAAFLAEQRVASRPTKEVFYDGRFRPRRTCRAAAVYQARYTHSLTEYVTSQNLARLAQRAEKKMARVLKSI